MDLQLIADEIVEALEPRLGEGKVADMAVVVPEYSARELPLNQLFKGFPVGPTGARQVDFFRRAYAEIPALPDERKRPVNPS